MIKTNRKHIFRVYAAAARERRVAGKPSVGDLPEQHRCAVSRQQIGQPIDRQPVGSPVVVAFGRRAGILGTADRDVVAVAGQLVVVAAAFRLDVDPPPAAEPFTQPIAEGHEERRVDEQLALGAALDAYHPSDLRGCGFVEPSQRPFGVEQLGEAPMAYVADEEPALGAEFSGRQLQHVD